MDIQLYSPERCICEICPLLSSWLDQQICPWIKFSLFISIMIYYLQSFITPTYRSLMCLIVTLVAADCKSLLLFVLSNSNCKCISLTYCWFITISEIIPVKSHINVLSWIPMYWIAGLCLFSLPPILKKYQACYKEKVCW